MHLTSPTFLTFSLFVQCGNYEKNCLHSSFQLGNNSSSVGGKILNKGDSVCLGPGGTFCILGDSYQHFVYFSSNSPSEREGATLEPSAKRARYDTLSDSDDDNLTFEDLEDIRREFGHEMVEKIQKVNKQQDDCKEVAKPQDFCRNDTWEDVQGKLFIFTSRGMMARSKV